MSSVCATMKATLRHGKCFSSVRPTEGRYGDSAEMSVAMGVRPFGETKTVVAPCRGSSCFVASSCSKRSRHSGNAELAIFIPINIKCLEFVFSLNLIRNTKKGYIHNYLFQWGPNRRPGEGGQIRMGPLHAGLLQKALLRETKICSKSYVGRYSFPLATPQCSLPWGA